MVKSPKTDLRVRSKFIGIGETISIRDILWTSETLWVSVILTVWLEFIWVRLGCVQCSESDEIQLKHGLDLLYLSNRTLGNLQLL